MRLKERLGYYHIVFVRCLAYMSLGVVALYLFGIIDLNISIPPYGIRLALVHLLGLNVRLLTRLLVNFSWCCWLLCFLNLFSYSKKKTKRAYKLMLAYLAVDLLICLGYLLFDVSEIRVPITYLGGHADTLELPTKPGTIISSVLDAVMLPVYVLYLRGADFLNEWKEKKS